MARCCSVTAHATDVRAVRCVGAGNLAARLPDCERVHRPRLSGVRRALRADRRTAAAVYLLHATGYLHRVRHSDAASADLCDRRSDAVYLVSARMSAIPEACISGWDAPVRSFIWPPIRAHM